MTMFSMKPEFNLSEFLAKWEPGNASGAKPARAKPRKYRPPVSRESAPESSSGDVQISDTDT
jgi:hypothetical protein